MALIQTLILKEQKSNDELQEELKEMANGLSRVFLEAMKRRYNDVEAEQKAPELCSLWEECLRDLSGIPLK